MDERLFRSTDAAAVADVAAIGRMAVRGRQEALVNVAATTTSRWEVVAVAAGALRAIQKALGAVDAGIANLSRTEPASSLYVSELARSLLVRREYYRFRRDLLALPRRSSAVRPRLRSAGNLIARLVGADAYGHLRTKDRAELRSFQRRIGERLASQCEDATEDERLWCDLENLAELFWGVNCREELVVHDRALLERAASALDEDWSPDDAPPPGDVVQSLVPMLGRDGALDDFISGAGEPTLGKLREAVRRVRATLAVATPRTSNMPADIEPF